MQLFSKAMGHLGGNNITAEFKNPGRGHAELAAVDHGDRRHVARPTTPNDADASNGISEITVPIKDIVVNLATDGTGALTSTAAQVIAAINADPAASALVTAYTYASNAGAGIVPATPSPDLPGPGRHDRHGPSFTSTKVRLRRRPARRHGRTGPATATATPPTLVRTDARHVQKGPFDQKVYRIGKDRSEQRGRRLPLLPAARP